MKEREKKISLTEGMGEGFLEKLAFEQGQRTVETEKWKWDILLNGTVLIGPTKIFSFLYIY